MAFTGASGTGKTTLLNEIEKIPTFKTVELSARPYLPTTGDYVSNSSDMVQYRTNVGSLVSLTEALLMYPEKNLFFSRCTIDRLAYSRVLGVGGALHDILIKEIQQVVRPFIEVYCLPVEFDLPGNDEVRGTNEDVRKATNDEIFKILREFDIPYTLVKGSVEERMTIIKNSWYEDTKRKGGDNSGVDSVGSSLTNCCGSSGCPCRETNSISPEFEDESQILP